MEKIKIVLTVNTGKETQKFSVASFKRKGDAFIAMDALQKAAPEHFKYSLN